MMVMNMVFEGDDCGSIGANGDVKIVSGDSDSGYYSSGDFDGGGADSGGDYFK